MSSRNTHKSGANSGSRSDRSNNGNGEIPAGTESVPVVTITMAGLGQNLPGSSCRSCAEPDNDAMVQCDLCHEWHHSSCVGVTDDVEKVSWWCPKCATATGVQQTTSTDDQQLPSTSGAIFSQGKQRKPSGEKGVSSEIRQPTNTLRMTTRSASRKGISTPVLPPVVGETAVTAAVASTELPYEGDANRPRETPAGTIRSSSSQRSLRLQLQRLDEENALQREYIQKKYSILEQMSSRSGSSYGGGSSRIESWVKKTNTLLEEGQLQTKFSNSVRAPEITEEPSIPGSSVQSPNSPHYSTRPGPRCTPSHGSRLLSNDSRSSTSLPHEVRVPVIRPSYLSIPQGTSVYPPAERNILTSPVAVPRQYPSQYQAPSSQQLVARQAISRDLPPFSGQPEEWPIFLSTFTNTTAMCGFTDDENIIRLQKCMKGKAYEAVKSLLMHPSNVQRVMDTLRMLFGQPEAIVHSLISKINNLPPMREDKFETIVEFAVNVRNFCATVDACGLEEYLYNISLLHQLVAKLPPSIKLDWARYRQTLPAVNLAAFGNWVYSLAEAASTIATPPPGLDVKQIRNDSRGGKKGNAFLNAHSESSGVNHPSTPTKFVAMAGRVHETCPICKGGCKAVEKCKRFLELSRDARWAAVRESGLCRRCLRSHKGVCKAKPCGKDGCDLKHHQLLHNEKRVTATGTTIVSQSPATLSSEARTDTQTHDCNVHRTSSSSVLFRYLPVILYGKTQSVETYAFFDEGSELTLLDEELAEELQLEGDTLPLCLRWTGGAERNERSSRIVNLQIAGVHNQDRRFPLSTVRTVKELLLPLQTLDAAELKQLYPHLRGLPLQSYREARPRILIGMKHVSVGVVLKCKEGKFEDPIAVKTRIGWTVCGKLSRSAEESAQCMVHVCTEDQDSDEQLHHAMKAYFALDSLGVAKPIGNLILSSEDQRAKHLLESTTRFLDNRYEVGLLWRHDNIRLPDNQAMALRRHQQLQKRMERNTDLAETLNGKIAEYVAKGYARKLTQEELDQSHPRIWYLPIFPVTNPNKPGKVRLVWDAAAKTFGVSLNSALLKGPDLLCSLLAILLQFRQGRIGLSGDLREMFHQILMRTEDQHCHRFFWTDENGGIAVYVLQVMSFGASCSPCCAQYIKNLNAERFRESHPVAVETITKRHYVDDMLTSVDEENEAIRLAEEVKFVHSQGGFEIRNWMCNSRTVLTALHEGDTTEKDMDLCSEIAAEKVLGMWWSTTTDEFLFKVGWKRYDPLLLAGQRPPTKREMLRVLMTIFDPLGLIAHFLIFLKILLQEVWRSKVQWDEEVAGELYRKWQLWTQILPQVEDVRIPRCYNSSLALNSCTDVQLHTFVDASENGFAAVAFLRFDYNGSTKCSIVASKARVAPLKFLSIPRLELQGAVLGARLAQTIITSLSLRITRRVYWTDSRDVLHWINSDHRRYSQFVAFRVSEILETSEPEEWRWVPTRLNAADDGTKWDGTPDLTSESRWFTGPDFLWFPETKWPETPCLRSPVTTELRPHLMVHRTGPCGSFIPVGDFSNWKRLRNVMAFVLRYISNLQLKAKRRQSYLGPLTMMELRKSEDFLFRLAQQEGFPDEITILQQARSTASVKSLPKSSSLYRLTPCLDEQGVLRMRSRIGGCQFVGDDTKQPIILPRDHHITMLVIMHYHQRYHHCNHETVVNELRQKFHIPRIRVAFNKTRKSCQRCKNENAVPQPPIMADLPAARLAAFTRPFTYVGIDYFGPMDVVIGRRTEKRWGMLITCLTIRAIHIELVHSLNTNSCIMGLRNFISRRGTPRKIYSDRGTNFVGTNRELSEAIAAINHSAMTEFVSPETEWIFNPPAAPHMGGCWERLVRTVKANLKAMRPASTLTDEVLRNTLTEIENVINARPLTHVPIDSDSAPALTPNHFILGSSNGTKPLSTLDDNALTLQRNYQTSQILANQFWRRWVSDYLPEISRRTKWFAHTKPISIGDIVVVVDPRLPRNCWPKGRIIQANTGRDGCIRSATVQTANGVYERPVTKLAVLDVHSGTL